MYSNIYIYILYSWKKTRTGRSQNSSWKRSTEAYTLERSHPRHRCDRCDDFSWDQRNPTNINQRYPKMISRCFHRFPPTGPFYPSLLLHSGSSFVSCVWFFVFDNGSKKISELGQPELYRVDSRLSWWAEIAENLMWSSWEISTIGTNINQHGKHTKSELENHHLEWS